MPELMQREMQNLAHLAGVAPIRVMHVLHRLATGGTEKTVGKLIEGLDRRVFEQTVCTVVSGTELRMDNARVISLSRPPSRPGFLVPHFYRLFRAERPDIVHSRNWGTIEAVVAARLAGVPAVIHSEHGRDMQTMGPQPWRRRVFRRVCYGWADCVFTVSRELAEFYSLQLAIPAERLRVVPNGVNTAQFRRHPEWRAECRRRLGVSSDTLVVGAVSRLDPVKDHVTLLRATELALSWGVDLCLAIVGDGVCRPALERDLLARPVLAGRVKLTGEVENVAEWLNGFDVFALPSLSEGMSNTLLEAMSVGVPPVATRVGGNPEVIEDGHSGLLFEPGDYKTLAACLQKLASQPEWRMQLAENCRSRIATHFALDGMIRSYTGMYQEVWRNRRQGAATPATIVGEGV